ncbi:MAG: 5-formyltetrahydrofolate cyclo-ligase [Rhodospirillaceae bacterium]
MAASQPSLPLEAFSKAALRRHARSVRNGACASNGAAAAEKIAATLASGDFLPAPAGTIAGYWPIGSELDCRPALARLSTVGWSCALPVVTGPDTPLIFRRWCLGQTLIAGGFGTREPGAEAPTVAPSILLVPVLAFDRAGHRLGYGAGCYDRTLEILRARGPVLAIGIAFAAQEVPTLPAEPHDQRLDRLITELEVIEIPLD